MRCSFLADECVGRSIVETMRREGFDVAWVAEECPGADDEEVLSRAVGQGRVLLTLDKDFGELAVRLRRPAVAIIIVALPDASAAEIAARTVRVLHELHDFAEPTLTIIEAKRIRRRRLDVAGGRGA